MSIGCCKSDTIKAQQISAELLLYDLLIPVIETDAMLI